MKEEIQKKVVLDNGLTFLFVPYRGINSVYLDLSTNTGALNESLDEIGVAHLLEHMVFQGTKNFPTVKALNSPLYKIGAYFNGSTDIDLVAYYATVVNNMSHIKTALRFLYEITENPLLREKDLGKERKIIYDEILRGEKHPYYKFNDELFKKIYPNNQRIAFPTAGYKHSISAITLKQIKRYWEENYGAKNFVLSICGDLNFDDIFPIVEKTFSKKRAGEQRQNAKSHLFKKDFVYSLLDKKLKHPSLKISFEAYPRSHRLNPAIKVMDSILSGGSKSRLFNSIREKNGLAYACRTGYGVSENIGRFYFSVEAEEKNMNQIIQIIKKEIQWITTKKVTDEEMEFEKADISTSYLLYMDDPTKRLGFYYWNERYKENLTPLLAYKKLRGVTKEEVLEAAKYIFSQPVGIGMVSNTIKKEELENMWFS